ncbi:U1 small nuclear ribonucleoprotein of 70kDa MW N terminal family protein [Theileria parva strain Muguga]|uniref:U1 small nuclear ribonucleoprotein, putative n=1 Tax=Theileria parva TaxID=5875 RepID=Q4N4U6_THEPA|nr:U1 small nuclear ribonucleoprotein of 70kDa MW N terminal family protein [Theileria parva strain Muguga]EAN32827.1 U1 small nuclear ribonucleoprotein of 70kDa MW N terminal family protein [Theileria parva strain Muguga]|eukprot:XP_765110.1 U1 small nuclear ribonucleoprotein [Theileria parva strain Muguga]
MSALGMPPHLLVLFQARPPLQHVDPLPSKPVRQIDGLAGFLDSFDAETPPKKEPFETPRQRRDKRKRETLLKYKEELKKRASEYDPSYDPRLARGGTSSWLTHDPYRTLFVANIAYDVTEKQLSKEFQTYGKIRRVRMIHDRSNKPRGYAFIEYENERDMVTAYKRADGKKISGRRVIVDVERARTVEGWLPRRLGGGKGKSRGAPPKFYDGKPLVPDKEKKESHKE